MINYKRIFSTLFHMIAALFVTGISFSLFSGVVAILYFSLFLILSLLSRSYEYSSFKFNLILENSMSTFAILLGLSILIYIFITTKIELGSKDTQALAAIFIISLFSKLNIFAPYLVAILCLLGVWNSRHKHVLYGAMYLSFLVFSVFDIVSPISVWISFLTYKAYIKGDFLDYND